MEPIPNCRMPVSHICASAGLGARTQLTAFKQGKQAPHRVAVGPEGQLVHVLPVTAWRHSSSGWANLFYPQMNMAFPSAPLKQEWEPFFLPVGMWVIRTAILVYAK